ncbi:MAG: acylphosphatase [Aquificaceae bacterium]
MVALRVYVGGIVQGVGFRAFTKRVADSYGLSGWVRNLPDGRVEIFAQGNEEVIWAFLREVFKGPRAGRVNSMEILKEVPKDDEGDFVIRY